MAPDAASAAAPASAPDSAPPAGSSAGITDVDVAGFVQQYVREHALSEEPIGPQTELADLGLDSLATADLLLSARAHLVEQGRLDPEATLLDLPVLTTVADLGGLLRSLGSA